MPDQSSAAREHALITEITEPLSGLPEDSVGVAADTHFPMVLRGYDRIAVDAYVQKTTQLVAELQSRGSPQAAIKRALERVGEDVSGILQRAHETAEEVTKQSRREAEDRLQVARDEAANITASAERRVRDLDADTDRIWAERDRIVSDARELARQLSELADVAAARFPPAEEPVTEINDALVEDEDDQETLPPSEPIANGHAPLLFDGDETAPVRAEEAPDEGEPSEPEAPAGP